MIENQNAGVTQKKKKYGGTLTTKSQNVPPLNAGVMQLLLQHVS